jgi:hypothetical protein
VKTAHDWRLFGAVVMLTTGFEQRGSRNIRTQFHSNLQKLVAADFAIDLTDIGCSGTHSARTGAPRAAPPRTAAPPLRFKWTKFKGTKTSVDPTRQATLDVATLPTTNV